MSLRREVDDPSSALPEGVVSVVDIIDERHQPGTFVNVIGIVHKALSPMLTKSQRKWSQGALSTGRSNTNRSRMEG